MSLYNKLQDIVKNGKQNGEPYLTVIDKMLDAGIDEIKDIFTPGASKKVCIETIRRVDNTFNIVSKQNGDFLKPDAFSMYLKSDENLKVIFEALK
jgi:hypothetical protein